MQAELAREAAEGRSGMPYFLRVLDLREQVRAALARLVGVPSDNLALTSSTTDGCNIVLSGIGLTSADEVITTTEEHFGLLGPLRTCGARVVMVAPEPEAILAAITPRTRLLAVSQVLWTSGRVLPVVELRHQTGIRVLVDGAQSVGAIPVDARGMDFLTVSGQKWLCGPDSTGALVVADPELLRVSAPSYFSQASYDAEGVFEPRPGAARFDPAWWSASSLAGLLAALEVRPEWAFGRAMEIADLCRRLVGESGLEVVIPPVRSTLVAFRPTAEDPATLVERLRSEGIHVREIPKTGLVRISCGWWTNEEDLERLVGSVAS